MAEPEKVKVTVSSTENVPPATTNPPPDLVMAAAVETGKAAQAAEEAARKAEAAANRVPEPINVKELEEKLRAEIAEVALIVGNLQQIVEAEAEELEENPANESAPEGTQKIAVADVVEIDVPRVENRNQKTTPTTAPKPVTNNARNVLGKILLNR